MALKTFVRLAAEDRLFVRILIEQVKYSPLLGIDGRKLNDVPALDPADVSAVVEIKRSRPGPRNLRVLKTRLAENE
jgi:hypothetical protein